MKGSIIIVSFFILGAFFGLFNWFPENLLNSNLSYYALCGLMFCLGISIGCNPQTLKHFRPLPHLLL